MPLLQDGAKEADGHTDTSFVVISRCHEGDFSNRLYIKPEIKTLASTVHCWEDHWIKVRECMFYFDTGWFSRFPEAGFSGVFFMFLSVALEKQSTFSTICHLRLTPRDSMNTRHKRWYGGDSGRTTNIGTCTIGEHVLDEGPNRGDGSHATSPEASSSWKPRRPMRPMNGAALKIGRAPTARPKKHGRRRRVRRVR